MSISKRIAQAVDHMQEGDAEAALIPTSIAVDATAKRYYGRSGRRSYKDFIHENLGLITRIATGGCSILNLHLKYDHPKIESDANGLCTIEQILYHVVRCGLLHAAELPSTLRFTDEGQIRGEDDLLVLPSEIVYGLIVAVVVCPANSDETIAANYGMNLRGGGVRLNELWGKSHELLKLFEG